MQSSMMADEAKVKVVFNRHKEHNYWVTLSHKRDEMALFFNSLTQTTELVASINAAYNKFLDKVTLEGDKTNES